MTDTPKMTNLDLAEFTMNWAGALVKLKSASENGLPVTLSAVEAKAAITGIKLVSGHRPGCQHGTDRCTCGLTKQDGE